MRKRLLAVILSIVMVLTMFPVTVWAAKEPDWQPSYLTEMERSIYDAIAGGVEERAVTGGSTRRFLLCLSAITALTMVAKRMLKT